MSDILELSEFLKCDTVRFVTKRRLLIFSDLIYKPTGEKVSEGFRYFACSIEELVAAFEAQDVAAITRLGYALDREGEADTSAVCLLMAYTESGSMVALQPQEYQDSVPTVVRPAYLLEGERARSLAPLMQGLDQSS